MDLSCQLDPSFLYHPWDPWGLFPRDPWDLSCPWDPWSLWDLFLRGPLDRLCLSALTGPWSLMVLSRLLSPLGLWYPWGPSFR